MRATRRLLKPLVAMESCFLGYAPRQMYDVVADVGSYRLFLPWCRASTVHSSQPLIDKPHIHKMEATLEVGFPPVFSEKYTSDVLLEPHTRIKAELHEASKGHGVLSSLVCIWEFAPTPDTPQSCRVGFELRFAFSTAAHDAVTRAVFGKVVSTMQNSFIQRCEALHGPPSHDRIVISSTCQGAGNPPPSTKPSTSIFG